MTRLIASLFIVLSIFSLEAAGQKTIADFKTIYSLIEQKNFFKAKDLYDLKKDKLSKTAQNVIALFLDNAFNKPQQSNEKIELITSNFPIRQARTGASKDQPLGSLLLDIYKVKKDNEVKLFDYKGAKNTLRFIIRKFNFLLSEREKKDLGNDLKIWTALENEPRQTITIKETNTLKMVVDKAQLKNLKVTNEPDTVNLIFDTGANLSTVTESTAKKLQMKIIPVDIEVGTITGEKAKANLAICPIFKLGSIEIRNAIFLVLKDIQLFIPQIDYQINGILGYPIISALREITITQDGNFTVPKDETKVSSQPNMAMDGLTPLIFIDGKPFTFDTGATNTILYESYYKENKKEIDSTYEPTKVKFAGAGGIAELDGFLINLDLKICDKQITLKAVQLLKKKVKKDEIVYGNIGQDLIKQFNKMTLNFDQMFIKFD